MFVSLEVLALDIMPSVCCLCPVSPFSLTTFRIQSRIDTELHVTVLGNATVNVVTAAVVSPCSAQASNAVPSACRASNAAQLEQTSSFITPFDFLLSPTQ